MTKLPSNTYTALGMMSGTSLDGLDMALCRLQRSATGWQYELLATTSIDYDDRWRQQLAGAIDLPANRLDEIDRIYGQWLGKQAAAFIQQTGSKPDFIASHGHTVFHQSHKGITRQIGDGHELARQAGIKVVYNFRQRDVSLGGQGAPLVPAGDELLFGRYAACLNLGGIANLSCRWRDTRIAFDIGPANMLLNYLAAQAGRLYDHNGALARSGHIDPTLLAMLDNLPYFRQNFPKSLGYEWFAAQVKPIIDSCKLTIQDKLATAVAHIARQIAATLLTHLPDGGEVLTTGGGAFNRYLIEQLRENLPASIRIVVPDKELVAFKEALVFALLGALRLRGEVNCYASVTGASRDSSGGDIALPA